MIRVPGMISCKIPRLHSLFSWFPNDLALEYLRPLSDFRINALNANFQQLPDYLGQK